MPSGRAVGAAVESVRAAWRRGVPLRAMWPRRAARPRGWRVRSTLCALVGRGAARRPNGPSEPLLDRLDITGRQRFTGRQRDDRRRGAGGDLVVALELAPAPRAQRPVEADQPGAVRADAV